jgi:WD40 repeat protein
LEASPDRLLFAFGSGGALRVVDANGVEVRSIALRGGVGALAFSADSRRLAYAVHGDPVLRVVDVATGRLEFESAPNLAPPSALGFSPDGLEILAGCASLTGGQNANQCIALWRLDAPDAPLWQRPVMSRPKFAIAVAGGYAVGEGGGLLVVYDRVTAKGRPLRGVSSSGLRAGLAHEGALADGCLDPSGRVLYTISRGPRRGSYQPTDLRAWDVATATLINAFDFPSGGRYTAVDVSPDGVFVLIGARRPGKAELWLVDAIRGATD